MKRFFVSLGVGILIPVFLIVIMLTSKVLMGPAWVSVVLWVFLWPLPLFIRLFPSLSQVNLLLLAFSFGTIIDVAIFSFLAYGGLRLLKRKPRLQPLPPQPPALD